MATRLGGYAADTSVPVDRSKSHIEGLLMKAGAEGFHTGWQSANGDDPGWDAIEFLWKGRQIRFRLPRTKPGRDHEQRNRQRWRILFLVVKAKIEAVQAGVSIFEEEFMSFIVTASGRTVGEVLLPRLQGGTGPLQLEAGK